MDDNRRVVETHGLSKTYGDGAVVRALDDVDLIVSQGEFLAVMGPSGSGKSTLLNMIGALDKPTSGTIMVNREDLSRLKDVDRFRAKTIGFVFQLHNLLPALSALENVQIPMYGQAISEQEMSERSRYLLELVGLGDRMHHLPGQLSGGERQRVATARALANNPAIILADEPTGSLDSQSGSEIIELLERINQNRGTTILIVTHDVQIARRTRRILTMHDGRIIDDHPIESIAKEDLLGLAHSELGQLLLRGETERVLSETGLLSQSERSTLEGLRQILARFESERRENPPD